MGFLNSNVADAILSVLSPTLNYEGSHIASLPVDERMLHNMRIEEIVKDNIEISKVDWDSFEFSWDFVRHPLIRTNSVEEAFEAWSKECNERFYRLKKNEEELNRIFIEMYGLDEEVLPEIQDFAKRVRKMLGNSLDSVIVYGSYARGDYSELSDIDIMLLVSLREEEIKKISDQISDLAFDFMMKYGVDISPIITNIDHFNYWADNLPFYRNVRDEGVRLSA